MNAELDGTVGPILQVRARQAGVVLTASDGDQPGVQMNLFRFVKSIGLRPLVCGNVKGLQDPYRNPTTQEGFARKWGQQPHMVTSFADGTKISFEQAIVANATGMTIASRGMSGYNFEGLSTTPCHCLMSIAWRRWAELSTISLGQSLDLESSSMRRMTIRGSATILISTSWDLGLCTASTRRITSVISRCRCRSSYRAVPRPGAATPSWPENRRHHHGKDQPAKGADIGQPGWLHSLWPVRNR